MGRVIGFDSKEIRTGYIELGNVTSSPIVIDIPLEINNMCGISLGAAIYCFVDINFGGYKNLRRKSVTLHVQR